MKKLLLIIMAMIVAIGSFSMIGCGDKGKYTITFDANGGSVSVSEKTVSINEQVGELPTPERLGYEFVMWVYAREGFADEEITSSTVYKFRSDITLTAVWNPLVDENGNYQIILYLQGGEITGEYKSLYKSTDPSFDLPTPTRAYNEFLGWTGEGVTTPIKKVTIPTGSIGMKVYTANWKRSGYKVKLDLSDTVNGVIVNGSMPNGVTEFDVEYSGWVGRYLEDAFCQGYDFINWVFVSGGQEVELNADTSFRENVFGSDNEITLKANFEPIKENALYRIEIKLSHKISNSLTVTGRYDADRKVNGDQHVLYVTDASKTVQEILGTINDDTCSDQHYGFYRWVIVKSDGTRVPLEKANTFSTQIFGETGTTIVISAEYGYFYTDWV